MVVIGGCACAAQILLRKEVGEVALSKSRCPQTQDGLVFTEKIPRLH